MRVVGQFYKITKTDKKSAKKEIQQKTSKFSTFLNSKSFKNCMAI